MMPMSAPVGEDDVYYVALKFASDDNMRTIAFMYSNKANGEIAYYKNGKPIGVNAPSNYGMLTFEFFIPIEIYNDLEAQDLYNLIEVKYIFEDNTTPTTTIITVI
jgi:hypothetical protein